MHSTKDTCCPESVVIEVKYCHTTNTYRIRGQWAPDQLQFWDDAVHDVEITADSYEGVRPAVVKVLHEFSTLLRLSPGRVARSRELHSPPGPPSIRG